VASNKASFTATVLSSIYPSIKFGLEVQVHKDGVVRVRMDEVEGLRKRYDEAASWALIAEPEISQEIKWTVGKHDVRALYGTKKDIEVVVSFQPLKVVLLRKGKEQVVLNGKGLLHMEHFRTKGSSEEAKSVDAPEEGSSTNVEAQKVLEVRTAAWFEGESEDGWWDETFLQWTDTKPKGE
jgi:alpha 1,3-glucosidase